MADPMRSRSINPITPSMFRSVSRSRARPPAPKHVEEVEYVCRAIAVGVAAWPAPGAQDDEEVADADRVVAVEIGGLRSLWFKLEGQPGGGAL